MRISDWSSDVCSSDLYGKGQDADGIVRQIGIAPRCYQDPHPPIYGGFAASGRTIDFWAEEGGKLIVLSDNLDFCDSLNQRYIGHAAKHGREEIGRAHV